MRLHSTAFLNNDEIPIHFTGEGADISPSLEWSGIPEGCKSFALVCEDIDAKGEHSEPFVHWMIYNLPPTITKLPEGIPHRDRLGSPVYANQGKNSFGKIGYNGPLPPAGTGVHHYVFRLYALSRDIALLPGAERRIFMQEVENHVLEKAELMGVFEKKTHRRIAS